jgi:bifunctional non-homologous end joining protein LigD
VSTAELLLIKRKERLQRLFKKESGGLQRQRWASVQHQAGRLGLEGAIPTQADRPYVPGDRGIRVMSKCLNRVEFIVVRWTDPEGSRSHAGWSVALRARPL